MYVEYCNYNRYIESYESELKHIFLALENDLKGLALPIHMIREIKEYMPEDIVLAAPVDFPSGYASTKARNFMILNSLQSGANAIDYVPNQYLFRCKYKEFLGEIKVAKAMCDDYVATFRMFLDYHHISNIVNFSRICHELGVEIAFPTIGYHHDDFFDNLIAANLIETKTEMSTIFNGYIWKKDQLDLVLSTEIFGLRLYNLNLWCN